MINPIGRNAPSPMGQLSSAVSGKPQSAATAHMTDQRPKTQAASVAVHNGASIEGGAPIDVTRVEDIKSRIDAGTYQIDSNQLADAMLNWGKTTP
ncbi:MAG: flagellar biosynthesis anti-sigma factor FlgM [Sphingopyxis sp.]